MAGAAERQAYPSDLTDEQWALVRPYLERPRGPGRPRQLDLREVVNAVFYLTRTGCPWRWLPHEFPQWESVRYYFDQWARNGTWEQLNAVLVQQVRQQSGRRAQPTGFVIDSQSVKSTEAGGERGYDGGKKSVGAQAAPGRGYRGERAGRGD